MVIAGDSSSGDGGIERNWELLFGVCSTGPFKEGTIGNTLPNQTGNLHYGHLGNK